MTSLIAHVYVCISVTVRSLRFVSDVTSSDRSEDEGRLEISGAFRKKKQTNFHRPMCIHFLKEILNCRISIINLFRHTEFSMIMVAVEVAELPHWSVTTTMTSYVPTAHVQLAFVVIESNI